MAGTGTTKPMSEELENTDFILTSLSRDSSLVKDTSIITSDLEESLFLERKGSTSMIHTPPRKPHTNQSGTRVQRSFRKLSRHPKAATPNKLLSSGGEKENILMPKSLNKNESESSMSKQPQQIESILDSTTDAQLDYSKERRELAEQLQAVIAENNALHAKVSEYTLDSSKSRGYDEFYVKTLIQQKDYFEKEVKSLIEVIKEKELESNRLMQQFENKIRELTAESDHWKQRAADLERRINENHFFEAKRIEGFQLDLEMKNQEISQLKLDLEEGGAYANQKIAALRAEIEQLHAALNSQLKRGDYKRADICLNCRLQISPLKRAERAKSPLIQQSQTTDMSFGENMLNESTDVSKTTDYFSPKKGTRSNETSKDITAVQMRNVLLMVEIDRLHSIIDQLAALVENTSPSYRVVRG